MSSRVPTTLRARLGDQAGVELLELVDENSSRWSERVLTLAEERFDRRLTEVVASIHGEIAQLEVRLRDEIAQLEVRLRAEIGQLEIRFHKELHEGFSAMLKWSFLFWIGQVAVMSGLLTFMLRGVTGH